MPRRISCFISSVLSPAAAACARTARTTFTIIGSVKSAGSLRDVAFTQGPDNLVCVGSALPPGIDSCNYIGHVRVAARRGEPVRTGALCS